MIVPIRAGSEHGPNLCKCGDREGHMGWIACMEDELLAALKPSLEQADRDVAAGRTVPLDSLVPWWTRLVPYRIAARIVRWGFPERTAA